MMKRREFSTLLGGASGHLSRPLLIQKARDPTKGVGSAVRATESLLPEIIKDFCNKICQEPTS